jgi:hypothetical protein
MKIINENNFNSHFENRIKMTLKSGNLDYWYIEQLEHLFYENGRD